MSKRGMSALYQALYSVPGAHLSDEKLAQVVGAEASGEDVESLFSVELEHIETCLQCAQAYHELATMMQATIGDMTTTAAAVNPIDVYVKLLLSNMEELVASQPALPQLVREVAASLPLGFTTLPSDASEVPPELVETAAQRTMPTEEIQAEIVAAIVRVIQQNISILAAFLSGQASAVWRRTLTVGRTSVQDNWYMFQLAPAPQTVPVLAGAEIGEERVLLSQNIPAAIPLQVEARADRLSPLTCRLVVRVDRPGLTIPAGRIVRISYGDRQDMAETDDSGTAYFASIPIAALSDLTISVQDS